MDIEALEREMQAASFCIVEEDSTPELFRDKNNSKFVNIELNPEIIMDICLSDYNSGQSWNYLNCLPEYGGKSVAEINFENRNNKI
jgi:hypothetical protein